MSDYLSEEEQLARLRTWWSSYGRVVLVAIVLALLAGLGWRWYDTERTKKIEAASDIYQEFQEAEDDRRLALAEELETAGAGTAYPALARLSLAGDAAARGSSEAVRQHLLAALAATDDAGLRDLIHLRLARVEQQLGATDAALEALAAVRGAGHRSLVTELKGDLHMARGERELAHEAYAAALEALGPGEQRPVLELKANTTAAPLSETPLTVESEADDDEDGEAAPDAVAQEDNEDAPAAEGTGDGG